MSLAFARGMHRWPVNSPHKGPVTRKMFPFDDVIMLLHVGVGSLTLVDTKTSLFVCRQQLSNVTPDVAISSLVNCYGRPRSRVLHKAYQTRSTLLQSRGYISQPHITAKMDDDVIAINIVPEKKIHITKWKDAITHVTMMTSSNGNVFRVTGPLWGNPPVTGGFSSQRPVTRCFGVCFDLRLTNGWANNGDAGDFRCHRAHHDVTVMTIIAAKSSDDGRVIQKLDLIQKYFTK